MNEFEQPPVWPEYSVPLDPWLAWTPIDRNAPVAYVELVTFRGVKQWKVKVCPFCGEEHRHGAGERHDDPRRFLGGRVPHCGDRRAKGDEYRLVEWTGQPLPSKRAIRADLEGHLPTSVIVRFPIPREMRAVVWAKSDGRCWYCGKQTNPFDEFECDHVHPVIKGGKNTVDNLVPSCSACNSIKRTKTLEQFRGASPYALEHDGRFWFEEHGNDDGR